MHTREQHSRNPGGNIMPVSWQRMLFLILAIVLVSFLAAILITGYTAGTPNPDPSPVHQTTGVMQE